VFESERGEGDSKIVRGRENKESPLEIHFNLLCELFSKITTIPKIVTSFINEP